MMNIRMNNPAAAALAVLFGAAAAGCATSQSGEATPRVAPRADAEFLRTIPAGTQIDVQLQEKIATDTNRPGDRWSAVVMNDVTDGQHVLLQRGAIVTGRVTQAGPMEIEGETRKVLAVDPEALQADGRDYGIDAEVVRAERSEDTELLSRRNVAIVGGSAVAGTILGEILFDEALLGTLIGAAGGTAIAVATADTDIEFNQGAVLTLELERSVSPTIASSRNN